MFLSQTNSEEDRRSEPPAESREGERERRPVPSGDAQGLAWKPVLLGYLLQLLQPCRSGAEDHLDVKYQLYHEEHNRVEVRTSSFEVEKSLTASLTAKGEMVYDSISGATPTGGPPPPGKTQVPLAQTHDIRRAGSFQLSQKLGRHLLTPQIAYSTENDYESYGFSLTESFEFNQKNTTLTLGVGQTMDRLLNANTPYVGSRTIKHKDTSDLLLGVSQLLGKRTILTANLTLGTMHGYLADPYKGIHFDASTPFFGPAYLFGERRPGHKTRQVGYASLRHFLPWADASIEGSYRIHHDSFGIWAHTATVAWYQNIGRRLSLQPMVRYHNQTAADFYYPTVPASLGFPIFPGPKLPQFYSADYRISSLHSWTYGMKVTFRLLDQWWLEASYRRYDMRGNDSRTSPSAYPQANITTLGMVITF